MNKTGIIKVFFTAISILVCVNSYGETSFSGNLSIVDPRSGFNPLRNPALMSFREKDDLSLAYIYSYLATSETDSDVTLAGVPFDSDVKSDQNYEGAFIFSGVSHSGRSAFGLGITKGGDGEMKFSSTDIVIEKPALGIKYVSTEDKTDIGSIIDLSYSYRIDSNQSFGIQLETSVAYSSTESNTMTYNPALSGNKDVETTQNRITSGLFFGYFFYDSDFEFGAGFKTGRYGYENKEYKYNDRIAMSENEKKISNYFIQDDGMGLLFGLNLKPSSRFTYAFEAGTSVPYSSAEKKCDDNTAALDERKNEINVNYGFGVKGGLTYRARSFVSVSAGGSYLRFKSEELDQNNMRVGSTVFNLYQITAGADFNVTDTMNLLAGLNYTILYGRLRSDSTSVAMDLKPLNQTIDFIAGITYIY